MVSGRGRKGLFVLHGELDGSIPPLPLRHGYICVSDNSVVLLAHTALARDAADVTLGERTQNLLTS